MTHPLHREDGRLDPSRDAVQLERQVRAYQPWPGTWAESVAGRLIVWRARPLTLGSSAVAGVTAAGRDGPAAGTGTGAAAAGAGGPAPGTGAAPWSAGSALGLLLPDDGGLAVLVADGALRIEEAQLAGARRMTAAELRRGHPELIGSRLGAPALP
jgi:methionyl-tRNA formyltransferase